MTRVRRAGAGAVLAFAAAVLLAGCGGTTQARGGGAAQGPNGPANAPVNAPARPAGSPSPDDAAPGQAAGSGKELSEQQVSRLDEIVSDADGTADEADQLVAGGP